MREYRRQSLHPKADPYEGSTVKENSFSRILTDLTLERDMDAEARIWRGCDSLARCDKLAFLVEYKIFVMYIYQVSADLLCISSIK